MNTPSLNNVKISGSLINRGFPFCMLAVFSKWIVGVGNALAQVGDGIPNETVAIVAHWLLFVIVIVGAAVAVGVLMVIAEKKVLKVYWEDYWDVISIGVAVTSVALVVYFGIE